MRRGMVVALAAAVLMATRWLAYQLRFDFNVPLQYQDQLSWQWAWVVPMQLGWLLVFKQFSGIYKYFSLPEIRSLGAAVLCSGACLFAARFVDLGYYPPLGVIVGECTFAFVGLGMMRTGWRLVHERYLSRRHGVAQRARKIAILGAGDAGASLVRELSMRPEPGPGAGGVPG